MTLVARGLGLLPRTWIKSASAMQWRHPLARKAFSLVSSRLRNRDETIQQGVGKGLLFNSGASIAGYVLGTTEPDLQDAFSVFVQPGMTVYDIGANVGFYSVISARLVGSAGKIISFEPLPENVRMIAHNAAKNDFNHIAVHDLALGNIDGTTSFNVSDNPNWGRLATAGVPLGTVRAVNVRIARLDSLAGEKHLSAPDVMKIDVEGAEVDVLEGGKKTLSEKRPVLFIELHGTNAEVQRFLESCSYEARILGGGSTNIAEARWDAKVIAVPRERADLMANLEHLANWKLRPRPSDDAATNVFLRLASGLPASSIIAFSRLRGRFPWLKRSTDWIPGLIRGKTGVIQRGVGRGLRFESGQSAAGFILGTHDAAIQVAFYKLIRPGMTIYDVGANDGFTSIIAARFTTEQGRVIAFEPQPKCAAIVARNAALNGLQQVCVREEALGDTDGIVDFAVERDSTFSHFADIGKPDGANVISVAVRPLDSLTSDGSLPQPDLIKIDVEGAESRVLAGACKTIAASRPILLIELHGTNTEIAESLDSLGYTPFVIGAATPLAEAHWNALVGAIPKDRTDLVELLSELQDPSILKIQ